MDREGDHTAAGKKQPRPHPELTESLVAAIEQFARWAIHKLAAIIVDQAATNRAMRHLYNRKAREKTILLSALDRVMERVTEGLQAGRRHTPIDITLYIHAALNAEVYESNKYDDRIVGGPRGEIHLENHAQHGSLHPAQPTKTHQPRAHPSYSPALSAILADSQGCELAWEVYCEASNALRPGYASIIRALVQDFRSNGTPLHKQRPPCGWLRYDRLRVRALHALRRELIRICRRRACIDDQGFYNGLSSYFSRTRCQGRRDFPDFVEGLILWRDESAD